MVIRGAAWFRLEIASKGKKRFRKGIVALQSTSRPGNQRVYLNSNRITTASVTSLCATSAHIMYGEKTTAMPTIPPAIVPRMERWVICLKPRFRMMIASMIASHGTARTITPNIGRNSPTSSYPSIFPTNIPRSTIPMLKGRATRKNARKDVFRVFLLKSSACITASIQANLPSMLMMSAATAARATTPNISGGSFMASRMNITKPEACEPMKPMKFQTMPRWIALPKDGAVESCCSFVGVSEGEGVTAF